MSPVLLSAGDCQQQLPQRWLVAGAGAETVAAGALVGVGLGYCAVFLEASDCGTAAWGIGLYGGRCVVAAAAHTCHTWPRRASGDASRVYWLLRQQPLARLTG
jgi:hypothetical protein